MDLPDRIWWTRKARIQAADRLESNGWFSGIILVWYSFFSAASSIYFLSVTPSNNVALVVATTYSVLVLILSLVVSAQNFRSRAVMMKSCYLQLERLYREVKLLNLETLGQVQLEELENRYQNIVECSENHNEFDYYFAIWKLQAAGEVITKEIKGFTKFRTVAEWIARKFLWCFAASLPILLFYLLVL